MNEVVEMLIKTNKTISTMESCTGGGIVNAITNIPNASKVISFGAVTYANEFKVKMGVNKKLIDEFSVYSMEVSNDMAKKISLFTNSNYGVGVTGKLKKVDENNLFGDDDIVFLSIYDRDNDYFYSEKIKLQYNSRKENKDQIINTFVHKMLNILK